MCICIFPTFRAAMAPSDTSQREAVRAQALRAGHPRPRRARKRRPGGRVSPFNFITLTAFLAWFGGTGFLITRFANVWFALGLLLSTVAGLVGAGIVFLFLSRVLVSPEENMDAADYEMVGVLGRTSLPIREGGTGEIIYSQAGRAAPVGRAAKTAPPSRRARKSW